MTGKEIASEDIVRGVEYEKNRYVVLSDEEIRAAYPVATQTIDIFAFVDAKQIPLLHFDPPYYLKPENRGEKVYALLREALRQSGRVALAHVVMHTKQRLAVVVAQGDALVLETMRWGNEVRDVAAVELPAAAADAKLAPRELEMARRLIDEMLEDWDPQRYRDEFTEKITGLVERKAEAGKLEAVAPLEAVAAESKGKVIDLADLLRRSLGRGGKATPEAASSARRRDAAANKASKSPARAAKGAQAAPVKPRRASAKAAAPTRAG